MIWLNNSTFLKLNNPNDLSDVSVQENVLDVEETDPETFINECASIFSSLDKKEISCQQACIQYARLFLGFSSDDFEFENYRFCAFCFYALAISFLKSNDDNINKDVRRDLLEAARLCLRPPNSIFADLIYKLAIKDENDFATKYLNHGGSKIVLSELIKIHVASNVIWWLESLIRLSDDLFTTDFDREFINYLTDDIINCDDPFLSMAITFFFHFNQVKPQNVMEYVQEFIHNETPQAMLLNGIFHFPFFLNDQNPQDPPDDSVKYSFVREVFNSTGMPTFAVHFLHIVFCESNSNYVETEFQISVNRFIETLSTRPNLTKLIPKYLSAGNSRRDYVAHELQRISPAIFEYLPEETQNDINSLPDYEIRKQNDFRRNITLFKDIISKQKGCDDQDYTPISHFLNKNFFMCDENIKKDLVEMVTQTNTVVDSNEQYDDFINDMSDNDYNDNDDDDDNNHHPNNNFNNSDDENVKQFTILEMMNDLDESVVVSMIESYLDVEGHEKQKLDLEQHLFDYIANNGDLPMYQFESMK
ncbi:hypothetical protein TRFO_04480 [Tritrichomonas foetus]|uniref:Uncharacterized protein n=1 Tax=Tritrichomonas foetus TaxID=1144522 RepID=A0A1J4KEQ2_9EUKA|nr:hypothetical protein TRFO_04480 [Tritrichomonas foetus]|eukprot:OHT09921.1 hypothetical protein TRFO_04480 [Tritrichomonas foetus]